MGGHDTIGTPEHFLERFLEMDLDQGKHAGRSGHRGGGTLGGAGRQTDDRRTDAPTATFAGAEGG